MDRVLIRHWEIKNVYKILVGRSQEKEPLGRPRCILEDYMKMDLREIGFWDFNCIELAHSRTKL